MKVRIAVLLVAVMMQAGCSTTDTRLGTPISCDATEPARLILFAQSVPDADFIPCVDALPVGWTVGSIGTRTDESVIVFESDTYDTEAVGTLTPACDAVGTRAGTDHPSITLYSDGTGTFVHVFDGGCFLMEFPRQVADLDTAALLGALSYLARDELRALTGWTL